MYNSLRIDVLAFYLLTYKLSFLFIRNLIDYSHETNLFSQVNGVVCVTSFLVEIFFKLFLDFYIFRIRKQFEPDREAILAALVCRTFHDHTMVFVQTKKEAHRIHILLGLLGVKVKLISVLKRIISLFLFLVVYNVCKMVSSLSKG